MRIRNLADNHQLSYVQQISAYLRHFGLSPQALGPEDVRGYQDHAWGSRKRFGRRHKGHCLRESA